MCKQVVWAFPDGWTRELGFERRNMISRECKLKVYHDGWCSLHYPPNIKARADQLAELAGFIDPLKAKSTEFFKTGVMLLRYARCIAEGES